jgi:hypothetical protein
LPIVEVQRRADLLDQAFGLPVDLRGDPSGGVAEPMET